MPTFPKDIQQALSESGQLGDFQSLPPSHQQEYLTWIGEATKPETRARRIKKVLEMLVEKSKSPRATRKSSNASGS